MSDFIGDPTVCTVSPGGPGRMIDCLKCENCGWSVTPGMVPDSKTASGISAMQRLVTIDTASRLAARIMHRNAMEVELNAFCDGYGKAVISAMLQQLSHVKTAK